MAKCYLMLEDGPGGVQFAGDFGVPREDLPEDENDLTPAQEALRMFIAVMTQMDNPEMKAAMKAEIASTIVVPTSAIL